MFETFEGRRAWTDNECPPVTEILNMFPPLNSTKYVSCIMVITCSQCYDKYYYILFSFDIALP